MRSSGCFLGVCLGLSMLSVATSAASISPVPIHQPLGKSQLAQSTMQTLLRFETEHYLVRVYRQGGATYLNVYNKETGFTDQNRVLAEIAPPRDADDAWRTYVNQEGDLEYLARVHPAGMTELEIRVAGGSPARPEPGFNATYGFPHSYLGQDIDTTLSELEKSGWVVDSTNAEGVELTRDRLSLDLKFDPNTRLVNYTRLIDLT